MERMILLSLVAAVIVAPVTPSLTVECINGNCTESESAAVPVLRLNLGSIFPFFGPVDFDADRDSKPSEGAIVPMEPPTNESEPSGGLVSIRIIRVFSIRDPSQDQDQPMGDLDPQRTSSELGPSLFLQKMFDNILADMGILDLSNRNMTSAEVYHALAMRNDNTTQEHPVSTLILSNSRIHPMDAGTFAAAESTIDTLVMANTSVDLDALRGLTNLKVLNLSMNGLSTFPWYGLMADTLEVLDLSHNNFEEIRPELSMLKNLKELYLSNNKIMVVEDAPLSLMPNLEVLDLSYNTIIRGNFAFLDNLNQLNLDWNYLRLMGSDVRLPSQPLTLKLASNPWRCDCGLLQTRDNNEILDMDQVQCVYNYSQSPDMWLVSSLTKDSVHHQGCNDIPELYNYLSDEYVNQPNQFAQDVVLMIAMFLFLIVCIFVSTKMCLPKSVGKGKVWIRAQDIPKWNFNKFGKQQEVPYIKVEKTPIKC